MSSSHSTLRAAVACAVLGMTSLAVQAERGTTDSHYDNHSREESSDAATYPSSGGASTETRSYGNGPTPDSDSTGAGTSGGGGSGMGTPQRGAAGSGNRADSAHPQTGTEAEGAAARPQDGGSGRKQGGEPQRHTPAPGRTGSDASGVPGAGWAVAQAGDGGSSVPATTGTSGTSATDRAGTLGAGSQAGGNYGSAPAGNDAASGMGLGSGSSSMSSSGMGSDAAGRSASGTAARQSWVPYTHNGYVGASFGRADFDQSCVLSLNCEDPDYSGKIFTGGMINEMVGAEIGWIYFGRGDNTGGSTRAHGLNLSLVGSLPLSQTVSLFGKIGTTYSWTRTTGAGLTAGSGNGFGVAGSLGASVDLSQNWTAQIEWERHRLRFNSGTDDADMTTIGLKYKF